MNENEKRKTFRQKSRVLIFVIFLLVSTTAVFAQIAPPRPANPPKPGWKIGKIIRNQSETPAEKSIAVDAKVNIRLCVSEGKLKINGWERNEIRAFVSGGSQVNFKVLQKSKQNDSPVWVSVLSFDSAKADAGAADECLAGEEIELDVPRGATVNVKSRESDTVIDSIGKATIENVGGDILLSNVAQGIEATTYEGDITVEKSGGAMSLTTTTGNIVVFNVSPSEIGDVFKAKTNSGAIILQQVEHRQAEANSNSGSIKFTGALAGGGQYSFNAFNGSVNLLIPQNSSSKINASYGFGAFNSEIPLQNIVKGAPAKAQNLSAQIGGGEATLNVSTYSGTIQIRKQ